MTSTHGYAHWGLGRPYRGILRLEGDQAKVDCGNLKLCNGIDSGKQGAMHAVRIWKEKRGATKEDRRRVERRLCDEQRKIGWEMGNMSGAERLCEPLPDDDGNGRQDIEFRTEEGR